MKILHLTDFHFRSDDKNFNSQQKVVDKLCDNLKSYENKIDFCFFTGDLVFSGRNQDDFIKAKNQLLCNVAKSINIDKNNIFICAGNHDVHRGEILNSIYQQITSYTSNESIDNFVKDKQDEEFLISCRNIDNFNKFISEYHKDNSDIVEKLYTVHKRKLGMNDIGIATINTSWISNSEHERGNLIFPISAIQEILDKLKECKYKYLLMHHPLNYLKEFNEYEIENEIYQGFHSVFVGHSHKRKQSIQITADDGIFCCMSPASLSLSESNTKMGYSIIDIDLNNQEIDIVNYIYDSADNIYLSHKLNKIQLPINSDKKEQNEFRKTLRKKFILELENANELIVSSAQENNTKDFLEIFTAPILKTKPRAELSEFSMGKSLFDLEELNGDSKNYIVYGKDKSGRSSLLKKIQLDLLKNFSTNKTIPFYLDCKELKSSTRKIDINRDISIYYSIPQNKIIKMLKKYKLKILIDNFDPGFTQLNDKIFHFVSNNSNCYFIATTDETILRTYEDSYIHNNNYEKIYIHNISRREIRLLTNKWPKIPDDKKELVLNKIISISKQLHMPFNYWTVSLFLWVFEKTNDLNFHNNLELIELYIDNLLERRKTALDKSSKLSFENFKAYLSHLAYYLITDHYMNVYSCTYKDLIDFTERYRKNNKRFVIQTEDIVKSIIDRGLIKRKPNEKYTFRLKGVFEYFLAYNMKLNSAFTDKVIDDDNYFLSFANELELYSGFKKNDEIFLKKIYDKAKNYLSEINQKYYLLGNPDNNLKSKYKDVFKLIDPTKLIPKEEQKGMTQDAKDEMFNMSDQFNKDNDEVEIKKPCTLNNYSVENHEKLLLILSRVYRNTDLISNEKLVCEIFDYILLTTCNFGFSIIDDIQKDDDKNEDGEGIKGNNTIITQELMTNFMPIIIQIFLFDAIGHNNLERIIEDKIIDLKKDSKNNQFKLVLLYFLLIDLDVEKYKDRIDELAGMISIGILKNTILIKLYTYLMVKTLNKPKLEQYFTNAIKKQSLRIDKKAKIDEIQRNLSKRHKEILIQKTLGH